MDRFDAISRSDSDRTEWDYMTPSWCPRELLDMWRMQTSGIKNVVRIKRNTQEECVLPRHAQREMKVKSYSLKDFFFFFFPNLKSLKIYIKTQNVIKAHVNRN